jgi:hypothetical protein
MKKIRLIKTSRGAYVTVGEGPSYIVKKRLSDWFIFRTLTYSGRPVYVAPTLRSAKKFINKDAANALDNKAKEFAGWAESQDYELSIIESSRKDFFLFPEDTNIYLEMIERGEINPNGTSIKNPRSE